MRSRKKGLTGGESSKLKERTCKAVVAQLGICNIHVLLLLLQFSTTSLSSQHSSQMLSVLKSALATFIADVISDEEWVPSQHSSQMLSVKKSKHMWDMWPCFWWVRMMENYTRWKVDWRSSIKELTTIGLFWTTCPSSVARSKTRRRKQGKILQYLCELLLSLLRVSPYLLPGNYWVADPRKGHCSQCCCD